MCKIDTILFDFDGTLMDTNRVIINSWQHTFRTLDGKERAEDEIVATMGEPLAITMERFFPSVPVEESIQIYRNYHYEKFEDMISLYPGMYDLLDYLHGERYALAVVTSRLAGTTLQGMEAHGIKKFFDVVITADDVTFHKPDPQPIEKALVKLDKGSDQSIMIGDTLYDIMCAKNAGVKSALVEWSMAIDAKKMNIPERPDFIISNPKEIIDIVGGRNV